MVAVTTLCLVAETNVEPRGNLSSYEVPFTFLRRCSTAHACYRALIMARLGATHCLARNLFGFLAVVLALAGQLALGTFGPSADATRNAVLPRVATVLCSTKGYPGPAAPQPHQRHRRDCALCPLCLTSTLVVPLLAAPMSLPVPRAAALACFSLPPPARAPPRAPGAALPRGPPVLT